MNPVPDTKTKLLDIAMEMIWESSYGSVSVDDMCERAGVRKGSFYHAFKSKSDLAVAAFERMWELKRPAMDAIFSCQVPPADRLKRYLQFIIDLQIEKYRTFGKMLGCPFCSIGCELSTQDENIRIKAEEISERAIRYVDTLVRDLAAEGLIDCDDVRQTSREVFLYVTGVLMQAKLKNDPDLVLHMDHGVYKLLGFKVTLSRAA